MLKAKNRYLTLLASAGCLSVSGSIYIWSIFNLPLIEAHGWSAASVSFTYSLFLVVSSVSFFAAGVLQRRIPTAPLMLAAGVMFAAGWFIAGSAQSVAMLYFGFGVVAGIADGFVYNTALNTAQAWFPDRRGFASGVCVGAIGAIPIVFAPLGNILIEHFDVGTAFHVCALLFLAIFVVCGPWLRLPEEGWKPQGWDMPEGVEAQGATDVPLRDAVRSPLLWLMWALMFPATMAGLTLSAHTSNIGQHIVGMTASQGALQVAVLAVASFVGRLGFGTLSDRVGRCPTFAIMLVLTAIDLVLFRYVDSFATFSAALCVSGACFGGVMAVMPALCADVFGTKYFSQNYAVVYSGYTFASLVGPNVAVALHGHTGSYDMAFLMLAVVALYGLVLTLIVQRKVRRASAG